MTLKMNVKDPVCIGQRFLRSSDGGEHSAPRSFTRAMEQAYKKFLAGVLYPGVRCYFKDANGNKINGPCKLVKVVVLAKNSKDRVSLIRVRSNHPKAKYRNAE